MSETVIRTSAILSEVEDDCIDDVDGGTPLGGDYRDAADSDWDATRRESSAEISLPDEEFGESNWRLRGAAPDLENLCDYHDRHACKIQQSMFPTDKVGINCFDTHQTQRRGGYAARSTFR